MAWFGEGFSSLSNLKGQITNFTKEVLSDGIVEEIDDREKEFEETLKRCVQLQDLLNSRDAEISSLHRENCELKRTLQTSSHSHESSPHGQGDDVGRFFWDPPASRHREPSSQIPILQEQLAKAAVKINELEEEVKSYQKINLDENGDNSSNSNQRGELVRVKQDLVNRIIQLGQQQVRDPGRNMKKIQMAESMFVNDFRTAISKLYSHEQVHLIRCILSALEMDNGITREEEKIDIGEELPLMETTNGVSTRELELCQKINKLQEENKILSTSIEELDKQHAQSIDKLLDLKNELYNKHQYLQTAYETLYVDYNRLQDQISLLKSKNAIVTETSEQTNFVTSPQPLETQSMKTNTTRKHQKAVQTDEDQTSLQNLQRITEGVQCILKNSTLRVLKGDTLFETLANKFVEIEAMKEMLERRVINISRELTRVCEIRDALQIDCEDLQTTVRALESELQFMKSNLSCIPEASEEQVASLEIETESMSKEIKHLEIENALLYRKHTNLVSNLTLEGTFRNQKNFGEEVTNTKQPLEIVHQLSTEIFKNVENNENSMENLSRCLHVSLDENNDLKKRIDTDGNEKKQMQEELTMYLIKNEGLGNIDLIKEFKLDMLNACEELQNSFDNTKRLEDESERVTEAKKQFETELGQENVIETDNSDGLQDLTHLLNSSHRKKDNLEYDQLNMKKELLSALIDVFQNGAKCLQFMEELRRFMKERNNALVSSNKVDAESVKMLQLLHAELHSLHHEKMFLPEGIATEEAKLVSMKEKLQEPPYENNNMNIAIQPCKGEYDTLINNCTTLHTQVTKVTKLEEEVSELAVQLKSSEEKCKKKDAEVAYLQVQNEQLKQNFEILYKLVPLDEPPKKLFTYMMKPQELGNALPLSKRSLSEMTRNKPAEETEERRSTLDGNFSHLPILDINKPQLRSGLDMLRTELEPLRINPKKSESISGGTVDELLQGTKPKGQKFEARGLENDSSFITLKLERDELVRIVQVKHNESLQYHAEIQRMIQLFNEQVSTLQTLSLECDSLKSTLKEKDSDILRTQNELQLVQHRVKNLEEINTDICNIPVHTHQIAQSGILIEKYHAVEAALIKEQSSNRILQNQLTESESREKTAARELERLRSHLMEIEGSYTEEALLMEQSKKELEAKLREAEQKVKNTSTVYTSANIRANQQVETLHQQMALIIQQRDDIQSKLSAAEDKVGAHTASLTNLQIVLEQFQKDKERDVHNATERVRQQLTVSYRKQEELNADIDSLKHQLIEAKECLQAASRLSEKLDKKSERIQELSKEVANLEEFANTADKRIQEATKGAECKVDKFLIKNLLLGFLSSSASDKLSVLRVFGTILEFDEHEREKAGLNHPAASGGWFAALLSPPGTSTIDQEASLSQAFIKFLETESKPKSVPALPLSSTSISRLGHSRRNSTSSSHSGLLLANVNLPSFPDFIPSRNTGSILKGVLKDS